MVTVETKQLKDVCGKIMPAISSNTMSNMTDLVQIDLHDGEFRLSATNKEYYVTTYFNVGVSNPLIATINAVNFIKLVSSITTEYVDIDVSDNVLTVKCGGVYKFPLICPEGEEEIVKLPEITVDNVTAEFSTSTENLHSILYNNESAVQKNSENEVRRMYYLDNEGAVTVGACACVNFFTLEQPIQLLLPHHIVKLLSILSDESTKITVGHKMNYDSSFQTTVKFEDSHTTISTRLPLSDVSIPKMPVKSVRENAKATYKYSVSVNKKDISSACKRLAIFRNTFNKDRGIGQPVQIDYYHDMMVITDPTSNNAEEIHYISPSNIQDGESYTMCVDLCDVEDAIDKYKNQYVTLAFGDSAYLVVHRDNVAYVIVELTGN